MKLFATLVFILFIGTACGEFDEVGTSSFNTSDDTTSPSNTTSSDFIDSAAADTTSLTATLTLNATDAVGVTAYFASETNSAPSATKSGWISVSTTTSYSDSVEFTLSSETGQKTVYVWFKDEAGNVSGNVSDSINYTAA